MRRAVLLKSTVSAALSKATSMLVVVSVVALAQRHLSAEAFGVWMTLTSLLIVVQFADLGIGNALVNVISSDNAKQNSLCVKEAVASALAVLLVLFALLVLLTVPVIYLVNWSAVLKVDGVSNSVIRPTMVVFAFIVSASIPALIGQKILWGFNEAFIANCWQIGGNVLVLLLMVCAVSLNAQLVWLVAASSVGLLFASFPALLDQFLYRRSWLRPQVRNVSGLMGLRLLRLGGAWTIYQALFFGATGADAVFVTWLFGAEAMGTYGVMMRLMAGLSISVFFTTSLWPMLGGAFARSDYVWARKAVQQTMLVCGLLGILTAGAIVLFAQPIARVWVGPATVPDIDLVVAFAGWTAVYNVWCGVSAIMGNERFLKSMVVVATIGSLVAVALKLPMGQALGPAGICWASIIGIAISVGLGMVQVYRQLPPHYWMDQRVEFNARS